MIEVLTSGALNTIQDAGRTGYLAAGVSRCGAMDRMALVVGNALMGNPAKAAGLEVVYFPFRIRFERGASFAITGADCGATLDGRAVPPWWARHAKAGSVLALGPPARGTRAYVVPAGGIDVPLVLGSRATDLKGGFGGLDGRGLQRGDRLALAGPASGETMAGAGFGAMLPAWGRGAGDGPAGVTELRFIRAAEYDDFDAASRAVFSSSDWQVSPEANRMGYRLSGPTLTRDLPRELFSHGILPGTIQVPANGQPIVQLADANTCGGYPKLGAVIEADLWSIAQAPVGSRLRFRETDGDEATDALRRQATWLEELKDAAGRQRRRG